MSTPAPIAGSFPVDEGGHSWGPSGGVSVWAVSGSPLQLSSVSEAVLVTSLCCDKKPDQNKLGRKRGRKTQVYFVSV